MILQLSSGSYGLSKSSLGPALENGPQRLSRKIGPIGVSERLSVPDRHEIVPTFPEKEGLLPNCREEGLQGMTWWWCWQSPSNLSRVQIPC